MPRDDSVAGECDETETMPKKYRIHLTEAEGLELKARVAAGKAAASKRQRAQNLLAADEDHPGGALKDEDIARAFETAARWRNTGCRLPCMVWPAHRKLLAPEVDGWTEAHSIAAACSSPPEGRARWTLRLPGDHLVSLGLVDSLSPQTVARVPEKTS